MPHWPPKNGKKALITGVTGQDGSYLAELLLGKGYEVWGMVRRSSTMNRGRIDHLHRDAHEKDDVRLHLVYGDLNDASSINRILKVVRPHEIYNLGAQSHVKVSFEVPEYTGEVTGMGVTRVLEAMRELDLDARFYQASSSELYGKVLETPQTERTPFYPRSPYAAAKAYAFYIARNYREAYGMFAVNGILFNHECVTAGTPIIVRRRGIVDVVPIEEIVPHRTSPRSGHRWTTPPSPRDPIEVWDRGGWTRVTLRTATWNEAGTTSDRRVHRIAARGAVYAATADHVSFKKGSIEAKTETLKEHDELELIDYPRVAGEVHLAADEAWLLGVLVAEGYANHKTIRFTSTEKDFVAEVERVWKRLTGCRIRLRSYPSRFGGTRPVFQVDLVESPAYAAWLRSILYTKRGEKRIPRRILNADRETQLSFLRGYNRGDGLRAGHGTYEFKSWKTKSAVLAAGLCWLAHVTLDQRFIVCLEERDGTLYYQVNLNSPSSQKGAKGAHLKKPEAEVVSVEPQAYTGWLYDLETESGTFHAGVGRGYVHNSPRRGENFVTRKITRAAAKIARGLEDTVWLGNLDARRDWGFAGDYVEAMWLMLQAPRPDDYVVATGEAHTVREFAELTFRRVGLPLRWEGSGVDEKGRGPDGRVLVAVDKRYFRPSEVDLLLGDATKARTELGWRPRMSFETLVEHMVDHDLRALDGVRDERQDQVEA